MHAECYVLTTALYTILPLHVIYDDTFVMHILPCAVFFALSCLFVMCMFTTPLDTPQTLMGIILANVIVLAMDHKDISDNKLIALERANIIFTFIFGIEMVCSV